MNPAIGQMPADTDSDKAHGESSHRLQVVQLFMRADQTETGWADHYPAEYIACHVGQFKEFTDPPAGESGKNNYTHNKKRA